MEENFENTAGGNTGATAGSNTGTNTTGQNNQQGGQTDKTYTEKEFIAEVDRRVTEALKTAKTKWQTEYDTKLQAEKDEAVRLAKLSADERAKEEFKNKLTQFETERTAYQRERLVFECTKQLAAEQLPVEFAEILTGTDADTTKANIEKFKASFAKSVEASVTERLKGKTPEKGGEPGAVDPFLAGFKK